MKESQSKFQSGSSLEENKRGTIIQSVIIKKIKFDLNKKEI